MDAIIGSSGLVGSYLKNILKADCYTSANLHNIEGLCYDTLWIAAPSAVKWQANKEPDRDLSVIKNMHSILERAKCQRVVHFSTIDVYGSAQLSLSSGPREHEEPQPDCAYGANRMWLEKAWSAERVQIVRLPGLFGSGLKKNIIFDLLNKRNYENICLESVFQWFSLDELGAVLDRVSISGDAIINVATEPLRTRDLVSALFPQDIDKCTGKNVVSYNMESKYGYFFSRDRVMEQLKEFVAKSSSL